MREEMSRFNHIIVRTVLVLREYVSRLNGKDISLHLIGSHQLVSFWQHAIVLFGAPIFDAWAKAIALPAPTGELGILDLVEVLGRAVHKGANKAEMMAQVIEIWRRACLIPGDFGVIHVWGDTLLKQARNRSSLCATADCDQRITVEQSWEALCGECLVEAHEYAEELEHSCDDMTPEEHAIMDEQVEEMQEEREAEEEAIDLQLKGKKTD